MRHSTRAQAEGERRAGSAMRRERWPGDNNNNNKEEVPPAATRSNAEERRGPFPRRRRRLQQVKTSRRRTTEEGSPTTYSRRRRRRGTPGKSTLEEAAGVGVVAVDGGVVVEEEGVVVEDFGDVLVADDVVVEGDGLVVVVVDEVVVERIFPFPTPQSDGVLDDSSVFIVIKRKEHGGRGVAAPGTAHGPREPRVGIAELGVGGLGDVALEVLPRRLGLLDERQVRADVVTQRAAHVVEARRVEARGLASESVVDVGLGGQSGVSQRDGDVSARRRHVHARRSRIQRRSRRR
mmetsp:Transcript_17094/g.51921  ORF Transcript_17094/g.51921 Transcript_17094/m.51921 type:complete len:292 (+) Transcript_17094:82-957(+)